MDGDRELAARMAVVEQRLDDHEREIRDLRNLKHEFRAAVVAIGHLTEMVKGLADEFEKVTRRVAAEVVQAAFVQHHEDELKHRDDERKSSGLWVSRVGLGVAIVVGVASIWVQVR